MARDADDGGMKFFELGAFKTPLQQLREEYEAGDDAAVEIIDAAARLAAGGMNAPTTLSEDRERFRRMEVDPALIDDLAERSAQVGEESYGEQYALLELLQAAAVGNCALSERNVCTIRLAVAAKQQDQIGRAREAYTDVFAGIQILDRLFSGGSAGVARAQESARRGWEAVKAKSPGGLDVFDPDGEPADAWERTLLWNTDLGSGQGLLGQADATLRLALHFEHWVDRRGQSLERPVASLIERCARANDQIDEASDGEQALLAGRLLLTIGDALIELAQWKLATVAFSRASAAWPQDHHPVYFHAALQEAYAWLMLDDLPACRRALDRVDVTELERMAALVVTVAAEAARYRALDTLWARRSGRRPPAEAQQQVEAHMRSVRIIFKSHPANRVEYLRTLFFALTARDVETMMKA